MEKHLKFSPELQRRFLLDIKTKTGYSNSVLAKISKISSRQFSDWLREKNYISLNAAKKLSKKFDTRLPESEFVSISRWKALKVKNARIGGKALVEKNGSPGTLAGRKKGGKKAMLILRRKGIIPASKVFSLPRGYSTKLAELVGILLGDGGITPSQVHITLNREADKEYIHYVKKLCYLLFKEPIKLMERKDSKATVLYYTGINLVHYLNSVGLKVGNKVKLQVGVPLWVNLKKEYKLACLRGLMDTDGGVFIHKYNVHDKTYIYKKVSFSNRSIPLLYFVSSTLKDYGFSPKIIDKVENKKVWLYNQNEVSKYLKVVGSSNFRLLRYK